MSTEVHPQAWRPPDLLSNNKALIVYDALVFFATIPLNAESPGGASATLDGAVRII